MATSAAARLLRRLGGVPPAPALRSPASSSEVVAAGLLGAPRAGLASPRTAPSSLLRHYSRRAFDDHDGDHFSRMRRFYYYEIMDNLWKSVRATREELDSLDKDMKRDLKDLADAVNTMKTLGNICCVVILGIPLIMVLAHHHSA